MIGPFASRQFAAFVLAGGIAAAVNFGSRILLSHWLGFSTAILLAYLMGMATAFVLTRVFVFRATTQPVHRSILWFTSVNLLAVAQTWLISMGLAHHLLPGLGVTWHVQEIAHGAGVMVPVFTSYLGHKWLSFR